MNATPPLVLTTPRLDLVLEGTRAVLARIEALPAEDRAQVSPAWLEQLASSPPSPWTHGFTLLDRAAQASVGSAGFKGAPDASGEVEIAYEIATAARGHGYAREAAGALVRFAYASGARSVRAHTLPGAGASGSVLRSCGFEHVAEVHDPVDGPVWRWQHRA